MLSNNFAVAPPMDFASAEALAAAKMLSDESRARSRILRCMSDRLGFFLLLVGIGVTVVYRARTCAHLDLISIRD